MHIHISAVHYTHTMYSIYTQLHYYCAPAAKIVNVVQRKVHFFRQFRDVCVIAPSQLNSLNTTAHIYILAQGARVYRGARNFPYILLYTKYT